MDMIKGVISSQNPILVTIFDTIGIDIQGDPDAANAVNQLIGAIMIFVAFYLVKNCSKGAGMGPMVIVEYIVALLFAPIYIAFRAVKPCGQPVVSAALGAFGFGKR